MQIQFKTKNPKQLLAVEHWIDNVTEQILYGGAKGGGKSYLGASLIFGDALIYPDTHYFIARKELNDLRKFTDPTIREVFRNWNLNFDDYASYNGQDNCYILTNGSKVFFISCKEEPSDPLYERFGSMQMTRGWIEEGGEVPENAKANLWLSIGRWKNDTYNLIGKLLITANPKKGWMKREFVDPAKELVLSKDKKYVQAFATDNAYLSRGYIEKINADKDPVRYQRLAKGNWEYDDDKDSLISSDALSDAFSNAITKNGQKYLTIDVARQGRDTSVFSFWDGLELYKIEQREKQGTDTTEQQAKDFASFERIPYSNILIDEDGIGGGVVDHLKGVKGFTANSSPMPTSSQIREKIAKVDHFLVSKPIYSNLKAQCGWKLSELINEHKISFAVPKYRDKIIEELGAILRDRNTDSDGKKQLRDKVEVKEEIKRSPDIGDTILMRAWFELRSEASQEDPHREQTIVIQQNNFLKNKNNVQTNSSK